MDIKYCSDKHVIQWKILRTFHTNKSFLAHPRFFSLLASKVGNCLMCSNLNSQLIFVVELNVCQMTIFKSVVSKVCFEKFFCSFFFASKVLLLNVVKCELVTLKNVVFSLLNWFKLLFSVHCYKKRDYLHLVGATS